VKKLMPTGSTIFKELPEILTPRNVKAEEKLPIKKLRYLNTSRSPKLYNNAEAKSSLRFDLFS